VSEPNTYSTLRAPFDPVDPMDAMSEMFRRQVTDIALQAYKIAMYRDLNPQQQLECFLAGAMTGIVGVALASIKTEGADAMMEYLFECLPNAREMAESIRSEDGSVLKNRHDDPVSSPLEPR
jgi:hypothetical protein